MFVYIILNWIAFVILAIGGINWGLVGIFDWNLVAEIFGTGQAIGSIVIYCLVLISTLWLIASLILNRWVLNFCPRNSIERKNETKISH